MKLLKNIKKFLSSNTSTKQTLIKNSFWLFVGEGFNKSLMFLLTVLIARYLGAIGYGKFSFAFSFIGLFVVIADFGLNILTIREIAHNKELVKKYLENITTLKIFLGLVTYILIVITTQFLGKDREIIGLVYLFGIYIIINSYNVFLRSISRAFERMEYETISKVIQGTVLFIIGSLFIFFNLNIGYITASYLISAIVGALATIFIIRKKLTIFLLDLDLRFWKNTIEESWPFALSAVFVVIYFRIDSIMLSLMKGDNIVGYYSAAYNLVFTLGILPNLFMVAILPLLSCAFKESKEKLLIIYKRSLKVISLIAILIFPILFLISNWLILFLYGKEYTQSIIIFKILLLAEFFAYFSYIFLFVLISIKKQWVYTYITGIGVILNIFLNFLLIPRMSYIGASIATVATEFVAFLLLFIYTQKALSSLGGGSA